MKSDKVNRPITLRYLARIALTRIRLLQKFKPKLLVEDICSVAAEINQSVKFHNPDLTVKSEYHHARQ